MNYFAGWSVKMSIWVAENLMYDSDQQKNPLNNTSGMWQNASAGERKTDGIHLEKAFAIVSIIIQQPSSTWSLINTTLLWG